MSNPAAQSTYRWILENAYTIARLILAEQCSVGPWAEEMQGSGGDAQKEIPFECHLEMLASAVGLEAPDLFAGYIEWLKPFLSARQVQEEHFIRDLQLMHRVLERHLPREMRDTPCAYVDVGIEAYRAAPQSIPSAITAVSPLSTLSLEYLSSLMRGDRSTARRSLHGAMEAGVSVHELCLGVLQTVEYEIGRLWQVNKIGVATEHFCTAATQILMSQLLSSTAPRAKSTQTVVAVSVHGELHDLGIRMVAEFFEHAGWDTYFLGANTPADSIVEAVKARRADLLAMSASMISRLHKVRDTVRLVRADPACAGVKILVGGHPFNSSPSLWKSVGADGHARDAAEALQMVSVLALEGAPT